MTLPTRTLDEMVELRAEKSNGRKDADRPYVGLEHIAQGSPRLLGWLPSEASVSTNSLFEEDDILFGKLRPNLRKSIRAPFAGYCSTDILVLRSREGIAPGFAGHVFQWENVFNVASATAAGTKMPRTSWNELRRFRTFCPATTDEQTRIAMVLDTIDAAIERTGAVIWKLKQVRAGLLHDLLTRGLDDNGELRDPDKHPEQFQDSPMGRIPKAWRLGVLDNLVLPDRPIVYGILMPGKGFRNGVPVIKVKDIRDGNIDESNLLLTDPKIDAAYLRSKVRARDLLFTIRGTVGRMAVVPASLDGANITQDTARISLANASPIFVARWLDSFHPKRFVSVHTLGVAVQGINLRDVRNIPAPIVDSYEQEVIVEKINEVERNIDETRCFLSKLQSIKSGLMSDLLTGRVAVPPKISVGVTHGIN